MHIILCTHINTHTNSHTNTHIQKHIQTHIHAHVHTYKHIHAAIRKNGREGLVFPVLGRVGHLVMYIVSVAWRRRLLPWWITDIDQLVIWVESGCKNQDNQSLLCNNRLGRIAHLSWRNNTVCCRSYYSFRMHSVWTKDQGAHCLAFNSRESLLSLVWIVTFNSCDSLPSLMWIVNFTHVNRYLHSCESLPSLVWIVTFAHGNRYLHS